MLAPLPAAVCALAALHASAPGYLLHAGFPLDDAWIHAVYARELALSGTLAYNPGVPATGETAPLWALILALVHRMAHGVTSAVVMTKAAGFLLHALSALLVVLALRTREMEEAWPVVVGGILVAIHPDLMAASVSGMEVPLAALVIATLAATVFRDLAIGVALASAIAFAARPEIVVIATVLPALFWGRTRPAAALRLTAAATVGIAMSAGLLTIRNIAVSGLPLPATFYAKAHTSSLFDARSQVLGWVGELGRLPLVGPANLLFGLAIASVALLVRRRTRLPARAGAALYLSGVAFCAVSFAVAPPGDPGAFYWQRYALPALLPMLAALPLLATVVTDRFPRAAHGAIWLAIAVCLTGVAVRTAPSRFHRLANDARNIDDVQVEFGRALAQAEPSDVAWVVDAGAARYFGRAFTVDLVGLNSPALLGPRAQAFLDEHRPTYLDLFAGWSDIEGARRALMPARVFEPSTAYTVSAVTQMREHVLVSCEPGGFQGRLKIGRRTVAFQCAP